MNAYYKGNLISGPRGPAGPDGNPVGTVISFMGASAPKDYLICDGAEYGIRDYPDLAAFFQTQFGTKNHFGGDGETTFAVPDLRNLFLRGYHGEAEEQLSGEIGEKQEATKIPYFFSSKTSSGNFIFSNATKVPLDGNFVENADREWSIGSTYGNIYNSTTGSNPYPEKISMRPVNMAVLYCIKAAESVPAENVYSTEETVIGRWFDGKPLYRIVKQFTFPSTSSDYYLYEYPHEWEIVHIGGIIQTIKDGCRIDVNSMFNIISAYGKQHQLTCYGLPQSYWGALANVVIEYTKTTD